MIIETRKLITHPGYDCIIQPCGENGCGTNPGASHGRHCEEWQYVVGYKQDVALALTVSSGKYELSGRSRPPSGSDLSLHVGFPISVEYIAGRGGDPVECGFVTDGKCYQGSNYSWGLAANEFFTQHFAAGSGKDQGDLFWFALEQRLAELAAQVEAQRTDTRYRRCTSCDGRGVVAQRPAK